MFLDSKWEYVDFYVDCRIVWNYLCIKNFMVIFVKDNFDGYFMVIMFYEFWFLKIVKVCFSCIVISSFSFFKS